MTNQEYFDLFIEQENDYKNLPILEQLRYFRQLGHYDIDAVKQSFGESFLSNGTKAHLFSANRSQSGVLFVNWDNVKRFEDFCRGLDFHKEREITELF